MRRAAYSFPVAVGLNTVSKTFDFSKREVIVDIDEKVARHQGITQKQTADTLYAATTGKVAAHFRVRGQDDYPVRVRPGPDTIEDPATLAALELPTTGGIVCLGDIAEIRQIRTQFLRISRTPSTLHYSKPGKPWS